MSTNSSDKYQVVNGVSYKKETPTEVIKILEDSRANGTRLSIQYGDSKTGRSWNREVCGYIGKGTTADNLPVLLASKRSGGGECIMDASVLEIKEAKSNKVLYRWAMDESLAEEELLEKRTKPINISRSTIESFFES